MEFTPRKIIFFVIIGLLIIGLATGLSYLNTPLDNTKLTAPKVLSLWVL
jgi:hypothetical protein